MASIRWACTRSWQHFLTPVRAIAIGLVLLATAQPPALLRAQTSACTDPYPSQSLELPTRDGDGVGTPSPAPHRMLYGRIVDPRIALRQVGPYVCRWYVERRDPRDPTL